jgi:hypothetical protein
VSVRSVSARADLWEGDDDVMRQLDDEITRCQQARLKETSRPAYLRAWRYWVIFVVLVAGLQAGEALRVYDAHPLRLERLRDERLVMRFSIWLHKRGLAPSTVASHVSMFRSMHKIYAGMDICEGFKCHRLTACLKGLGELFPVNPRDRFPVTVGMFGAWTNSSDWYTDDFAGYAAAFELMFQGLLRASEAVPRTAAAWTPTKHLTWGHVNFVMGPDGKPRYVEVKIIPCKQVNKGPGRNSSRLPIVLPYDETAPVNACRALWRLHGLRRKPRPGFALPPAATTPLFTERGGRRPIAYRQLLQTLRNLLALARLEGGAKPAMYALHSLRIGGATALLKAGCPPSVIMALGRWSSEIFRLYTRACFNDSLAWSAKMGHADASPLEVATLMAAHDDIPTAMECQEEGQSRRPPPSALEREAEEWAEAEDSDVEGD